MLGLHSLMLRIYYRIQGVNALYQSVYNNRSYLPCYKAYYTYKYYRNKPIIKQLSQNEPITDNTNAANKASLL